MLRLLLALVTWLTAVPFALQLLLSTIADRHRFPEDPLWVAGGLLVGIFYIFWRRPTWLVHTMLHEASHLLACVVLFVPVHRITASAGRGGEVEHEATGPLRAALIALAPYLIPLVLAPLLLARALTPEGVVRGILAAGCAAAYPSYLTTIIHNVRQNFRDPKGDLAKVGRLLSLAVILSGALLITAWGVCVLWDDTWDMHRLLHVARPLPTSQP